MFTVVIDQPLPKFRVSIAGKQVGELTMTLKDGIKSGAKALRKMIGKRLGNRVCLDILHRFTKGCQEHGSFTVGDQCISFAKDEGKRQRRAG